MKLKAKAKINLSLNITGVKNGYHELESVVTEISLADDVYFKKSDAISVKYKNFDIPPEKDNALKALKEFYTLYGKGAEIVIRKKIPLKSGLGGSSADAVGVLKALKILYPEVGEEALKEIAVKCGSDCLVQYTGGLSVMRGRGESVQLIEFDKKLYFIVVPVESGVDTAKCFSLFDSGEKEGFIDNNRLIEGLKRGEKTLLGNCLTSPAKRLNPRIKEAEELLKRLCGVVNMSGSGSAVYALFYSKAQAKKTLKKVRKKYPSAFLCEN